MAENDELCIINEDLRIKNEEICILNDVFCRRSVPAVSEPGLAFTTKLMNFMEKMRILY